MRFYLTVFCLFLLLAPEAGTAQSRERIGYGRLFTNDYFADQKDRWRSGSFGSSRIWGYGWDGVLPQQPGDIIELRLGAEILAPRNLVRPARRDRPFAGVLSAGLHTHFARAGTDFALGADVVALGPQTRLAEFQGVFHDLFGLDKASARTRAEQVPDAFLLSLVAETGRDIALPGAMTLRPFVEARGGVENLVRAGFDVTFGSLTDNELLVRDTVSGHRYRTTPRNQRGFAFVLGADVAAVASSAYLPAGSGVTVRDRRERYRGGVHWQGGAFHTFYGLTYLGEEFEGQAEGQLTGSVRIGLRF